MDMREEIKNKIVTRMSEYVSRDQMVFLEDAIVNVLKDYEVKKRVTEIATSDDTNERILKGFYAIKGQRISPQSMKQYKYAINKLIDISHCNLLRTSSIDVEYFLSEMKRRGNSDTSLNNLRRNVSAVFSWMIQKELIQFNPVDKVDPFKITTKPIDKLTVEEVDRLRFGCASLKERCLFEFLRCTALRAEEIPLVKISDVDFSTGKILVHVPKQRKYRDVRIDKLTIGYLKEYVEGRNINTPLFESRKHGKAMCPSTINAMLKRIAEKAGIHKRIYIHIFRKTCASHIVERGGSVEEAGIYLGHAQKSVTGRFYAELGDAYITRIFDKYVAAA